MSGKRKLVLILSGGSTLVWILVVIGLAITLEVFGSDVTALGEAATQNVSSDTVGGWVTILNLLGAGMGGLMWMILAVICMILGFLGAFLLVMWTVAFFLRKTYIAYRVITTIGQIPILLGGICLLSGDTLPLALGMVAYFVVEMILLYTDKRVAQV